MKTLTTIVNNLCDLEMVAKPDIDSVQSKARLYAFRFNTASGIDAAKAILKRDFKSECSNILNLAFIEFAFTYMSLCTEQYFNIGYYYNDFDKRTLNLSATGFVTSARKRDYGTSNSILCNARSISTRSYKYLRNVCQGKQKGDLSHRLKTFVSYIQKASRPAEYVYWSFLRQNQFDAGVSQLTTSFLFEIVNNKNNIFTEAVQHHIDTVLLSQLNEVDISSYEQDCINNNTAALFVAIESVLLDSRDLPTVDKETMLSDEWLVNYIAVTDKTVQPNYANLKSINCIRHQASEWFKSMSPCQCATLLRDISVMYSR